MRHYTLKCICPSIIVLNSDNDPVTETVVIESSECVTVTEMVELFNKLLKVMGFYAEVDIVEKDED